MTDMSQFIAGFMVWVAQFVVVSTILMVATHLWAKKRRERKRRAELLVEEQGDVTEPVEAADAVTVS